MKKIEDYIHLYIDCEIITYDGEIETKGILTGIHGEYGAEVALYENEHHTSEEPSYFYYPNIKPILRPLYDMTDEELKELLTVDEKLIYRGESAQDFIVGWKAFAPITFKWLLSKGFDLFGLIESGLAITKTPAAI